MHPPSSPQPGRAVRKKKVPPPQHDESQRMARLASSGKRSGDELHVHYARAVLCELHAGDAPLFAGEWTLALEVDDKPVALDGEWTCCCWNVDEEGDYLELQMKLSNGIVLERQFLMPRSGGFAVLADTVKGCPGETVRLRTSLPTGGVTTLKPQPDTREVRLVAKSARARVFPLGLPEDRAQTCTGWLIPGETGLDFVQTGSGTGMYAPLVIDWNPMRARLKADWRTLTVSCDSRVLRGDEAAGHRLRIGPHQLFVYHALVKSPDARAILGHHTRYETVMGRFRPTGDVDQIVAIV